MRTTIDHPARMAIILLISCCALAAPAPEFAGGTGEPNDPYQIATPEQMNEIGRHGELWHKHFKLMANIDLSQYRGDSFNIIGRLYGTPFSGVFDGNGHTISGFTYISASREQVGLFEYVNDYDYAAAIKNLGLIDPNVDIETGVGVGSLVGFLDKGDIVNCYVRGGRVRGKRAVGGLLGENALGGKVMNCYASTTVVADSFVGGLAGGNSGSTVSLCYSTGMVVGNEDAGGLLGANSGKVVQSFWDVETSGQATSAGGVGKTTAEMQKASTFLGWTCGGEETWTIDKGNDYPRLRWENRPGQVIEPRRLADILTGTGTEGAPFLVRTAEDLCMIALFSCDWDKTFRMAADIDLSSYDVTTWNTIGYYRHRLDNKPFAGVFDGAGHVISNFRYICHDTDFPAYFTNAGLFGYVNDPNAGIMNVGLVDPTLEGGAAYSIGTLVGRLGRGVVAECYVENATVSGNTSIGGLVGTNLAGTVEHCHANVAANARERVGGLVGDNEGVIRCCHAIGTVSAGEIVGGLTGQNRGTLADSFATIFVSGDSYIGGLVAVNYGTVAGCYSAGFASGQTQIGGLIGYNRGTITDSYSISAVSGDSTIGGLVGTNSRRFADAVIADCFSAGSVAGHKQVGGLLGSNLGTVLQSFWDAETSGQTTSPAGTGKTTAEMRTGDTFVNAGWDFDRVWMICEGGDYPRLRWEQVQCAP